MYVSPLRRLLTFLSFSLTLIEVNIPSLNHMYLDGTRKSRKVTPSSFELTQTSGNSVHFQRQSR
jgi:hypothetical protein